MALIKVTPAFNGITEDIIIQVSTAGTRNKGFWVSGGFIDTPATGVVMPMSQEEINDLNPDGDNTTVHLKFYIDVEKSKGVKCPRCWVYSTSVSDDEEYKGVCERCLEVLKKL